MNDKIIQSKIWIDADACPKVIKEVIYKFSSRFKIAVCLVANSYMNIPQSPFISFVKVDSGADVADMYIVQNLDQQDLVITADIPLAGEVIAKGALAINPRGEAYNLENIGERLSMRDYMKELRDGGLVTGGPSQFNARDKISFTNSLNKILTKKGFN